jgi:hypothetical protein
VVEAGKEGSFDSKYVGWPFVLEDGKQYKMYYQTYDAKENKVILCLAISKDGIKWKKEGKVFEGIYIYIFFFLTFLNCFFRIRFYHYIYLNVFVRRRTG